MLQARDVLPSELRTLGFSSLRMQPKLSGSFRPICNLSAVPRGAAARGLAPINTQLREVFRLLTALGRDRPSLLGSSILGLDEVRRRPLFPAHARAPCAA